MEEIIMTHTQLTQLVQALLDAPTSNETVKEFAQSWINAEGTPKQEELTKQLVSVAEQNIALIDETIGFAGSELAKQSQQINGVNVVVTQLDNAEAKTLRTMVDDLKNQLGSAIVVIGSVADEKVNLIVGVTTDLTSKVKAGELVGEMAKQVGGKGGGRPDMAMAGGSEPQNLLQALNFAQEWIQAKL